MSTTDVTTQGMAEELTRALVTGDYRQDSPLTRKVHLEIEKMAESIAAQIIQENPKLREIIEKKARAAVTAAMTQDEMLNEAVIRSVAKALIVRRDLLNVPEEEA